MLERVLQHAGSKTARCFCVIRNPVMNGATKSHDPGCMMNHMMTRGHMIFLYWWIASWFHICMSRPFGICILNGTLWGGRGWWRRRTSSGLFTKWSWSKACNTWNAFAFETLRSTKSIRIDIYIIIILFSSPKYFFHLQIFSFSVFFVPHNRIFFLSPPKNIFFASPNISPRFLLLFKRFFPSTKIFRFSSLSPQKYFPSPNVFRFLVYLAINEPKIIWLLSIMGENMPLVCWDQACETSLSNQNKRKGKKNLVLNQSVRLWQHFIV